MAKNVWTRRTGSSRRRRVAMSDQTDMVETPNGVYPRDAVELAGGLDSSAPVQHDRPCSGSAHQVGRSVIGSQRASGSNVPLNATGLGDAPDCTRA
jgi:hypothetical protein